MAQGLLERLAPVGDGRRVLYGRALAHGVFAVVPLILTIAVVLICIRTGSVGTDYHQQYFPAGQRALHGQSPYDLSQAAIREGRAFPYSPFDALVFAGFAVFPRGVGDWLLISFNMLALVLALRLLGVRDWRLYGLVFLWPSVIEAWQTANVTLILGAGLAAVWTHRERAARAGMILGLLITIKLMVWPVAVWFLATRRYVALCWCVATAMVLNLASWLVVGFTRVPDYREVLSAVTRVEETRTYTVISLALNHGISRGAAYGLGAALATFIGLWGVQMARHGRDAAAFCVFIGVCLAASPIVWLHYVALAVIPLAMAKPRLAPIWALPLLLWVCPAGGPETWQVCLLITVTVCLIAASLTGPPIGPVALQAPATRD